MKIGINGASGNLGAAVVGFLKKKLPAADLVAITRTPDQAASLQVECRYGNYDEPESLAQAYAGLDRLLLIPTVDLRPGARGRQGSDAVAAAAKANVGHVTFVSSLGTRGLEEPHIWASYFAVEQALMRQARQWSILRMGYYFESFIQEVQQSIPMGALAGLSDARVTFVARDDIAAAAAAILAGEGHHGAIYNATGPAALTGTERAALVSKIVGKPLVFAVIPKEQYQAGLAAAGLPEPIVTTVLGIQDSFARGGFDLVSGDVETLTGTPPQSLEQALQKAFA